MPVTAPVPLAGTPTVKVPVHAGGLLRGEILTGTIWEVEAPLASVTVTVTGAVVTAPVLVAAWRTWSLSGVKVKVHSPGLVGAATVTVPVVEGTVAVRVIVSPLGSLAITVARVVPFCSGSPPVARVITGATFVEAPRRSSRNGSAKDATPTSVAATLELFPPAAASPQVTTVPSRSSAANAVPVVKTRVTGFFRTASPRILPATAAAVLSPPKPGVPQVTTAPFLSSAAKADLLAKRLAPCLPTSALGVVASTRVWPSSPQVTTEPSLSSAANAVSPATMLSTPFRSLLLLPPALRLPQVTTVASPLSAAKALLVE